MNLVFAVAVSDNHSLEPQHFGDAAQYILLELANGEARKLEVFDNPYKDQHGTGSHEHHGHGHGEGHGKKSQALISMFAEKGVHAFVSTQYGPNIRKICQHFVPVMMAPTDLEQVEKYLLTYFDAIAAEWNDQSDWHKIIRIQESQILYIEVKR